MSRDLEFLSVPSHINIARNEVRTKNKNNGNESEIFKLDFSIQGDLQQDQAENPSNKWQTMHKKALKLHTSQKLVEIYSPQMQNPFDDKVKIRIPTGKTLLARTWRKYHRNGSTSVQHRLDRSYVLSTESWLSIPPSPATPPLAAEIENWKESPVQYQQNQ
ncbi:hypothetical protein CHS0354_028186 [Potamilus streckersoni]|uniref:Uncharacterized protein n=1 Tax=Potamilus streckersoni TaxID=2493646 RepID=A0AAE0TI31_9BIVA|nr:hypothetical protein CHS0354_028186 [Potamilus streckersoni]